MKRTIGPISLLAATVLAYSAPASAQDLEELLDEREEEEQEVRRIPGANIPGIGTETVSGKIRLPKGEEVERLQISQDRRIDPDTYIVGPGDILQLYVWGEFDQAIPVSVNPEGFALVPTIGAFDVSGMTLSETKETIVKAAQIEKYPGVEITVTLVSMRFFTVYLTGAVPTEGAQIVHPTTRISDLIELAGGFLDDLKGTSIEATVSGKKYTRARRYNPQPAARRSIKVVHSDETVDDIDLAMFLATGDVEHNPYLRMGDVVHVPYRTHEIYIYGSVNEEGRQEFLPGDSVGDLVTLAGGIAGSAPLEVVEIWRFRDDAVSTEVISLLGQNDISEGKFYTIDDFSDEPLQPKDMLFLRVRADWQQSPTVHVHGELKYRGRYRIYTGKTRLTDLVEQAGGFTEYANFAESRLIRPKFRALEDPELRRLKSVAAVSGLSDMSPEEKAYYKSKGREEKGRLTVDFEALFEQGDETQNIVLEGGDVIFVPRKSQTVNVSGQLKNPGLVHFEAGQRVAWYLEKAGGYAFNANKGGSRLIRARTGQREELNKKTLVEPGDEIWVPEKPYIDWWSFFQGTVRTIAETMTLIVLVQKL